LLALPLISLATQSMGEVFTDKNAWEAKLNTLYGSVALFNAQEGKTTFYSEFDWQNNIFSLPKTKKILNDGYALTYKSEII